MISPITFLTLTDPPGFALKAAESWTAVQRPRDYKSQGPVLLPIGSLPEGIGPYGMLDLGWNASEWVMD
jgi:hypothetical protein